MSIFQTGVKLRFQLGLVSLCYGFSLWEKSAPGLGIKQIHLSKCLFCHLSRSNSSLDERAGWFFNASLHSCEAKRTSTRLRGRRGLKKKSATKLLWLQHPSISCGICVLPSVIGKHNLSPFLTGAHFWRHSQTERLLRETLPRSGDRWPPAWSWTTRHLVQVRNQQEGGQDHLMFCWDFFYLPFIFIINLNQSSQQPNWIQRAGTPVDAVQPLINTRWSKFLGSKAFRDKTKLR